MRRDVKLLYDVMADTIGYIQVQMSVASLQLARIHALFIRRFARNNRLSGKPNFITQLICKIDHP